jgi:hypothetical protein
MDDVAVGQIVGACDDRLPRSNRCKRAALRFQSRAGRAVYRAGDASAGAQRAVGGIDHGIDAGLRGDVAADALDCDPAMLAPDHIRSRSVFSSLLEPII